MKSPAHKHQPHSEKGLKSPTSTTQNFQNRGSTLSPDQEAVYELLKTISPTPTSSPYSERSQDTLTPQQRDLGLSFQAHSGQLPEGSDSRPSSTPERTTPQQEQGDAFNAFSLFKPIQRNTTLQQKEVYGSFSSLSEK